MPMKLTVTLALTVLPARSVAEPLTCVPLVSVSMRVSPVTEFVSTPLRVSVASQLTVTSELFQPDALGLG